MPQFHETLMGREFYQGRFPQLLKILEKRNDLAEKQIEAAKELTESVNALRKELERR